MNNVKHYRTKKQGLVDYVGAWILEKVGEVGILNIAFLLVSKCVLELNIY